MKTIDFDTTGGSRYYTVSKLGPKRSLTPEGYLLCEDVPVARTGEMLYAEGEILSPDGEAVKGDADGIVIVSRGPDDLFRPETIASFEGKPVTLGHPDDFVGPANIRAHAVGTMFNVRRGTGIADDLMLADLMITEQSAIKAVQSDGIEEVSNGYEADYDQAEPGRAVQRNIIGNHVALVERGRCGPRCAIGDEDMATKKGSKFTDYLRRAFKAKDAAELEAIEKEAETMDEESEEEKAKREAAEKDKMTGDSLSRIMDKLKSMDEDIQAIKKAQADDDDESEEERAAREAKAKTGDDGDLTDPDTAPKLDDAGVKLYTGDAAKLIPSLAEILSPGTKIPTMDAKTTDAQRAHALCNCQRRALDEAYKTGEGKAAITPFIGSGVPDFAKMPAPLLHAAFVGAATMLKARNNDQNARVQIATTDFGKTVDAASLNKTNREFWNKRSGTHH